MKSFVVLMVTLMSLNGFTQGNYPNKEMLTKSDSLMTRCGVELSLNKKHKEIDIEFMHKIPHQLAFENKKKKYQVRYHFTPLDSLMATYNKKTEEEQKKSLNPNDYHKFMMPAIVLNVSNQASSNYQVLPSAVCPNVDWVGISFVEVGYKSVGYKYCYIISLHKSLKADVNIFILFDNQKKVLELSEQLMCSVAFL